VRLTVSLAPGHESRRGGSIGPLHDKLDMLLGASGDALTLTLGVTHSPVQVTHLDSELARLRGHCVTCAVRGMSRICRLLSFPRPPTDTGPRQLQA
jgi:hypothetical protein